MHFLRCIGFFKKALIFTSVITETAGISVGYTSNVPIMLGTAHMPLQPSTVELLYILRVSCVKFLILSCKEMVFQLKGKGKLHVGISRPHLF